MEKRETYEIKAVAGETLRWHRLRMGAGLGRLQASGADAAGGAAIPTLRPPLWGVWLLPRYSCT